MLIVWTTGIYPANSFECYGLAQIENWLAAFAAPPPGTGTPGLPLLGVGQ